MTGSQILKDRLHCKQTLKNSVTVIEHVNLMVGDAYDLKGENPDQTFYPYDCLL